MNNDAFVKLAMGGSVESDTRLEESDLDLVVKTREKETTSLEYKESEALNFDDRTPRGDGKGTIGEKHHYELILDCAAMANAEGGIIILGIEADKKHGYPIRVDDGCDPNRTNADQIEQILLHNIYPRLQGF